MDNYVKAYSDMFVRYLFGSEGNEAITLDFINDVLVDSGFSKIESVRILNPFNLKTFPEDKESILDVEVKDEKGRIYNIEIQSTWDKSYKQRALYYWARAYVGQLKESDTFKKLKPVITINIVNFKIIENSNEVHTLFCLTKNNDVELVLTDHLFIHFLELPKQKNISATNLTSGLDKWIYYFNNEGKEDINMKFVIQDDDTLEKAHDIYEVFNQDEQMRKLYYKRIEGERAYRSQMEDAIEEATEKGMKEGIKKGIEKDRFDIAKKMKEKGSDVNFIIEITGLSKEQIEKL